MKVCVVGNCQADVIAFFLKTLCPSISVLPVKSVHLLGDEDKTSHISAFEAADFILSQPISEKFATSWIRNSFIDQTWPNKLIKFSNVYFTGYDPSWCHISLNDKSRLVGPMDGGHFKPIIESFLNNKSILHARDAWFNLDENLLSRVDMSLDELKRRDLDCEIKFSKLVEQNFPKLRLLNTMHHPTTEFFYYLQIQF